MTERPSRRDLICRAAVELAAEGGNHAVTHQAIDARLGLARGSTSYYYRTRAALVSATITHLAERSRTQFLGLVPSEPPRTARDAAGVIAGYLGALVADRRTDVLARYAFVSDAVADERLRSELASCLFSVEAARALMDVLAVDDADASARDLVSLCEGLVFDLVCGTRSLRDADPRTEVEAAVGGWIRTLVPSR
ncbi:TetR/AcrR family transcriptional regulator [Rhodococcus gannanensis]|uniref:TetR/AcrR family transcriptional regulator n=1 Tax=Rhodococcus gannanensis TaxID=1960308 RepID=A0ABW4P5Q4_9NOCA